MLAAIAAAAGSPGPNAFTAVESLVVAALGPMLADERKARVLVVEVVGISTGLARRLAIRRIANSVDTSLDALVERGLMAPAGWAA